MGRPGNRLSTYTTEAIIEMSAPENWYKPNSPKNQLNCPLMSAGVALK
jgi:hypothetical protein